MKKILFVIAVLAIIAVSISLVACKTTPSEPPVVVGSENNVSVSDAMNTVYEAMQHACTTNGATEGIYIAFSGVKNSVDATQTVNPKPVLYDFSAKAYIDNDNLNSDTKSTMAFTVKEENGRSLFSMYYANGNLYIDYPPIFNKAAIDGIELGKIINDLNQSKVHEGKVDVIADLIPVIGNYVFTSCKMTVLDKCNDSNCNCKNHFEYSCTLDLGKLYNALERVLTNTRLGITADMVIEALNLTRSDLNYLSTLKTTVVFNLYNMRGGDNYYYFKGVKYDKKEATVVDSLRLTNFVATEFTSEVASEYKVVLADNLSSYRIFDFANYDMSGTLSLAINSTTNADNTLFNKPIKTDFVKNTFTCNYTFKSNYANGKLTAYLLLGDLFDKDKNIALYFDGDNLFVNAKDYIGNADDNTGLIKLSKEFVNEKLKVLTILTERKANIDDELYFLTSIMQGLDHSGDKTQIKLNKTTLDMITGLLGIDFVFDYKGAELYLNTESNLFKSIDLKLVSNGVSLQMTANNPKIGYEVIVDEPEWIKNAVEWDSLNRVTPVISGSIQTNLNGISNTKLVESLIYSLTGSEVTLEKPISRFTAESNYSTTGELQIFKLSFFGSNGFVCSLYYYTANSDNRSNDLFVILPEADGKTPVLSLKLLESSRYSSFLNTINGNALVIQGESEVVLSNDSTGFELTANSDGVSDVLGLLKSLFPDFYLSELPIDFSVEHMSVSVGEQTVISTVFGQNKYINLSIDEISLDYYSLALKTYELTGHANRIISIFDDNDMAKTVNVKMYGKQESTLALNVEDFGGWHYDSTPVLGSGVQDVRAYLNLFGQRVNETIRIDCSDSEEYKVKFDYEYADYVDNQNKSFIFDKYASNVNPILVISEKFNSVDLLVNNQYINKKAVWKYNGKPIDQASFGKGNMFTITPSLYGFFGQMIELTSCAYTLTLSNVEIQGIENADSFLTIYAYDSFDPFDAFTYSNVDPYILTTDGNKFKAHLEWNIDSITNQTIIKNGKLLSNEELINALKESFYMLDGKYKITASLKNSVGFETELTAVITVENRIIQHTTLNKLADGVSFETYDADNIKGIIIFDPVKVNSLGSEFVIAKEVECMYGNASKTETSMKWEIPKVENIPLTSETAVNGELTVVLGDSIGGYQSFTYHYIFKNYKVNKISLMSGDIVVSENSDGNKTTLFELLTQNPYSFAFPTSVVFNYDAFTLSYNDFSKDYELGSIVCDNVNWNMTSFVENEIWHKGEDVVYTGNFQLADQTIELKLSFVSAIVDSWQFLNSEGIVASQNEPILMTDTYQVDVNGEYVLIDGHFVLATADNSELTHYSKIAENNGAVYYKKAEINDTVDSLVLDPNKSSYLSLDSYPNKAQVTFKNINDSDGNPIKFNLSIVWDLSKLNDIDIHSSGYYETLPVYIAYEQKLADVHLWISGQDPTDYFFVFDSEGKPHVGDIADGVKSNTITLKLLNTDQDGNLVINNLNDIRTIHDIICGCSDKNCLGRIYFDYNDANTSDGWFKITEWDGLDRIAELYKTQIANGVAVDEVSGNINVSAKVGNIICSKLTISIEASKITTPSYENYQPRVNSSINNPSADVYSMHAVGTTLTVDPYLANAKDPSNYPQKVDFYLDGNKTTSVIDGWDCSCFDNLDVYKGAVGMVYSLINTPFGEVKITSETTVRPRIIEIVLVDGLSSPIINVNIFAENPYGENVVEEDGRLIAYKRVEVKFVNDDSLYPMTLKYDITDFAATSSGGIIAQNINVYVGNEAGGYQLKTGYSVYSTQNTILSISSNDSAVLDYLANGKIYTKENGFVSFDKSGEEGTLANAAWKALLVSIDSLIVEYSRFDKGVEVKQTVIANKKQGNMGLSFMWDRETVSDNEYVVLKIWNGRTAVGNVGNVLTLNTLSNKKIVLFDTDFNLNTLTSEKEYTENYTVANYLSDNAVLSIPNTMIAKNDIIVKLYDSEQNELTVDTLLTVGTYTIRVTVDDDRFTITSESKVEKQLVITRKQVNELSIKNGDRDIFIADHTYEIYQGAPIAFAVTTEYNIEVEITIVDEMGNIVTTPEAVGVYTITITSKDNNYTIVDNVYTLTIKPIKATSENQ